MKNTIAVSFLLTIVLFSAFPENLLSFYQGADNYKRLASYSRITGSEIQMYRMDTENRAVKIRIIEKGRNIDILATMVSCDETVYSLVKIQGEEGLWSGWISHADIDPDIEHESGKSMLGTNDINLSQDNERGVFEITIQDQIKLVIAERTGKILYELEEREIREAFPGLSYINFSVEGWSGNRENLWLKCSDDFSGEVLFIIIEWGDHPSFSIRNTPPHFRSTQYKINVDTQEIYYSDYYQFQDFETALIWNRSGKIHTLYSYTFSTEDFRVVDQNKGEGFEIILDENGYFQYEKNNVYRIGKLNDSRVRIRKEPNLDAETIGHLSRGQIVNIIDQTEESMKIGNMDSVWYEIYTDSFKTGWAYGYFIDILAE